MNPEDEKNIPLRPLHDVIQKFKRRLRIMNFMMFLSIPAGCVAILLFLIFAVVTLGSGLNALIFGFLAFSAVVSFIALVYIPNSFSDMVNQMEATAQNISFTITRPKGESPEEKALNQLIRTDHCVESIVKKKPQSAQLKVSVAGKSGKVYTFDVYIHSASPIGKFFDTCSDIDVFVKRYDDISPLGVAPVKQMKEAVEDSLRKVGRRIPTRVLVVSTSGYDETVFQYVRSKEGVFRARFSSAMCNIELIKENVDDTFDVLSF